MSITLTTWSLEQTSPSDLRPATPPEGDDVVVRRAEVPSAEFGRFLYTAVGGDIRWSDRLSLTYEQWQEIVEKPGAEIWVAYDRGRRPGTWSWRPSPTAWWRSSTSA